MTAAQELPTPARCVVCGRAAGVPFLAHAGYTIVRCAGCGLRYLSPQPSADAIAALYDESYFNSDGSLAKGYEGYAAEADNLRATFRDRLRFLPRRKGRLLDVGAAAGFFVEQARAAGWDAEGIEPSEWASRYAREQLGQPVRTGTLDAGFADGAFDVVTCWEVIEHLADPRRLLQQMARVLRPGGRLLLSTPDAGSAVARLSGRRWLGWYKVPEHLYFFDRPALRRLLADAGLRAVREKYVSLTVTAGFAFGRLGALVGVPALGKLPAPLARLPLRVNPLYDLLVVAEKS